MAYLPYETSVYFWFPTRNKTIGLFLIHRKCKPRVHRTICMNSLSYKKIVCYVYNTDGSRRRVSEHHKRTCHIHKYKTSRQTLSKIQKTSGHVLFTNAKRGTENVPCWQIHAQPMDCSFGCLGGVEDEHHSLRQLSTLLCFTLRKSVYGQGAESENWTPQMYLWFRESRQPEWPSDSVATGLSTYSDSVCCVSSTGNTTRTKGMKDRKFITTNVWILHFAFTTKQFIKHFNLFGDQLKSNSLKLAQCWKKWRERDCLWKITRPAVT